MSSLGATAHEPSAPAESVHSPDPALPSVPAPAAGTAPVGSQAESEQEVSIVGARPSAPSPSATTITPRQLDAFPKRTAEDALRLVPGMTLVQHGSEGKGYQYFLRGFDAVHGAGFAVSVLGIPMNEWSNVHAQGYVDLGFVVPEAISAVHVTKGPFLLEQGAFAMAGSADYRLGFDPSETGVRLAMTTGSTGRYRALATYARPEALGRDFIALEATTDAGFGQNRAIQHGTVLGLTQIADSARLGRLSVLTAAYGSRFELPGALRSEDVADGTFGFYDTYDSAQHGGSERGLLGLLHEWSGAHGGVKTTLYGGYRRLELLENYTGSLIDPAQGDRRQQLQRTTQVGMTVRGEWEPSSAFGLSAALGAQLDAFSQEQAQLGRELERVQTSRELSGTEVAAHAAAGAHLHPFRALVLHAGARVDLADVDAWDALASRAATEEPLLHVSPRVTVAYAPHDSIELGAAYGRGFRPPEAQALVPGQSPPPGSSPDSATTPPGMTSIDSAEVGVRFRGSRYLALRLFGFGNVVSREVIYDHLSGQSLEFNGTRRLGLEAGVSSNPLSFLTIAADVTWVDARFLESGAPIPFAPWLTAGLHTILTHDSGFSAGLRVLALASRQLPHDAVGSPLTTLDLTAGYKTRTWQVDLELENLLDLALREGESMFASVFPPGAPSSLPARHFAAGAPRNARLTLTMFF